MVISNQQSNNKSTKFSVNVYTANKDDQNKGYHGSHEIIILIIILSQPITFS